MTTSTGTRLLSTPQKLKIIEFHAQKISNRKIAELIGCGEKGVRFTLEKYQKTGQIKNFWNENGRPEKLTEREKRNLAREAKKNPFLSTEELQIETGLRNIDRKTAEKALNEQGLFHFRPVIKKALTFGHEKARIAWAKEHKNWTYEQWTNAIFTDETQFVRVNTINDRKKKVWRPKRASEDPKYQISEYSHGGGS